MKRAYRKVSDEEFLTFMATGADVDSIKGVGFVVYLDSIKDEDSKKKERLN